MELYGRDKLRGSDSNCIPIIPVPSGWPLKFHEKRKLIIVTSSKSVLPLVLSYFETVSKVLRLPFGILTDIGQQIPDPATKKGKYE